MRPSGRATDALRAVTIETGVSRATPRGRA